MGITLCGKCNVSEVFSNKKGILLGMICMWIIRNGITNLLSILNLERDGYNVIYDTNT